MSPWPIAEVNNGRYNTFKYRQPPIQTSDSRREREMSKRDSSPTTPHSAGRSRRVIKRVASVVVSGIIGSLIYQGLYIGINILGINGYGIAWYFFCLVVSGALMVRFETTPKQIQAAFLALVFPVLLVAVSGVVYCPKLLMTSINAVSLLAAQGKGSFPLLGQMAAYLLPSLTTLCIALLIRREQLSGRAAR